MTAAPNLHSSPRLPVDEAVIRAEGLQLQEPRGGQGRGHRARSRVSVIIILAAWDSTIEKFPAQNLPFKYCAQKWMQNEGILYLILT